MGNIYSRQGGIEVTTNAFRRQNGFSATFNYTHNEHQSSGSKPPRLERFFGRVKSAQKKEHQKKIVSGTTESSSHCHYTLEEENNEV